MPGPFSNPRRERLHNRREYQSLYTSALEAGGKYVGPAFIGYIVRRAGQGRKFGFAVSQKVGNAVTRNRVKRYIREIYRTHRPDLADDVHMIVVARPPAARLPYLHARDAIRTLWTRGGVLSE